MPYVAPSTVVAGQTYSAAAHNVIVNDVIDLDTRVNDLIVPPTVCVRRTTNLSYTTGVNVTWESTAWDTDGMWSAGSATDVTIQTTGVYQISIIGRFQATATLANIYPYVTVDNVALNYQNIPADSTTSAYFFGSITASLTAAQVVRLKVNMGGGSNYVLTGNGITSDSQSRMILTWIGRTS